jgi:hypothetical protein
MCASLAQDDTSWETRVDPGDAPNCPEPPAQQRGPTTYSVPKGAVDTHAHVIGLPPVYPFASLRSYTPPAADAAVYLAMLDATGMDHGVLIQVSVHGTNNRLMVQTLQANPQRLRCESAPSTLRGVFLRYGHGDDKA